MPTITREPLRDPVRGHILDHIINGRFVPGSRLNLAGLADEFGVSPTPIREALTQLSHEGFIREIPNRGFFVIELSMQEAHNLYPLIWTLEGLAITLQKKPSPQQFTQLRTINGRISEHDAKPESLLQLDRRWHEVLINRCGNDLLLAQIATLKLHANRYEYAYMQHSGRLPDSAAQHQEIVTALEHDNLPDAVRLVEKHWHTSLDFLAGWLRKTKQVPA